MLRARSGWTAWGGSARARSGSRYQRLAGTNGSAIDRLSGDRSSGCRLRNTGPRRSGGGRHGGPGSGELGGQVGPRRHNRTGSGLAGQRFGDGCSRYTGGRRALADIGTPGADGLALQIDGRASRSRAYSFRSGGERLPWTRENLAGARRTGRTGYGPRRGSHRTPGRDHRYRWRLRGRVRGRRRRRHRARCLRARSLRLGKGLMRADRRMDRPARQGRPDRQMVRRGLCRSVGSRFGNGCGRRLLLA